MDIEIKNEDAVITTCEQILAFNREAATQIDSLSNTLHRINADWESNGHDKESYVVELEKQIENLNILEKGITDLATSIKQYVETIKATSAKTVE